MPHILKRSKSSLVLHNRLKTLLEENARLKARLERAITESRRDALTGIYNRRHFEIAVNRQAQERRPTGQPMSVLFIDADHFKQINDRYGHTVGDLALKHLANVIRETVGVNDVVCRYGGEEFAVLLSQVNDDEPRQTGERIRHAVQNSPVDTPIGPVLLTVSVGASRLPASFDHGFLSQLINAADAAVYLAKANGRNRVEVQP